MNYREAVEKINKIFPGCQFEELHDGELVVYTGFRLTDTDEIVPCGDGDEYW